METFWDIYILYIINCIIFMYGMEKGLMTSDRLTEWFEVLHIAANILYT